MAVNIISSAVASMLNAVFMRWNESKGVDIYYKIGKEKHMIEGKSAAAGVEVLKAVAVCKFMLTFIALSIVIFSASLFNKLDFIKQ